LSKDKYKVKNWSSYTEGLKQRGCLNIWIEQDIAMGKAGIKHLKLQNENSNFIQNLSMV